MKKKCVICLDGNPGYYYKGIETLPLFGRQPVWTMNISEARVFESKAAAKDHLTGYWFDNCRKRCEIQAI